jgi:hypothetical protein
MTAEIKKYLSSLRTIANYGKSKNVTPVRIYQLIKSKDMTPEIIDGIQFIDSVKYPNLPSKS